LQSSPNPSGQAVLRASALAVQRGDRVLIRGLDLALMPGTVTWLRGSNGRGKTSLLRVLAGLSSATQGSVEVLGRSARDAGPSLRSQFVFVAHQNGLKDDLTALESLQFLARLHGLPADAASLTQALQGMGIGQRRHALVRTLSQGQRRRVALARLLLAKTVPLWLLDEPFDALDTQGVDALNTVIGDHAAAGGCVLLTSHQALSLRSPVPLLLDLQAPAAA